jgi:hypothetical protein
MKMQPQWRFQVAMLLQRTRHCREPSLPRSSLVEARRLTEESKRNEALHLCWLRQFFYFEPSHLPNPSTSSVYW